MTLMIRYQIELKTLVLKKGFEQILPDFYNPLTNIYLVVILESEQEYVCCPWAKTQVPHHLVKLGANNTRGLKELNIPFILEEKAKNAINVILLLFETKDVDVSLEEVIRKFKQQRGYPSSIRWSKANLVDQSGDAFIVKLMSCLEGKFRMFDLLRNTIKNTLIKDGYQICHRSNLLEIDLIIHEL